VHVDGTREGDEVHLRFADDGRGIDPANQGRVFEMFRQGDGSSPSAGAGMGLPMCERIVERYGGSISVDSARGQGASLEITLPASDEPPVEESLDSPGGVQDVAGVETTNLSGSGPGHGVA
jgi:signal transduction histidine kinase